jgi:hypothetical protein
VNQLLEKNINYYKNTQMLLRKRELTLKGLLIQGVTIAMIIEDANKLNVDLIIAGDWEHNFIYKAFIGRVCGKIKKNQNHQFLSFP